MPQRLSPTGVLAILNGGTGATTSSAARSNLGLAGAAVLNVGSTSGTVAAGDDSRITGALSASTASSIYAPLASPSFTGNVSSSGTITVNNFLQLNGPAGSGSRAIAFQTSGSTRWQLAPTQESETGSNVGSNFGIYTYTDTGAYLGNPLNINRASGIVTLASALPIASGGTGATTALAALANLGVSGVYATLANPSFTGAVNAPSIQVNGGQTRYINYVSGAATDQKYSDHYTDGTYWVFRWLNDAITANTSWLLATRSGMTTTAISLTGTTISLNGNTVLSTPLAITSGGTGATTTANSPFLAKTGGTTTGEIIATISGASAFRIVAGNYGVFDYSDGASYYKLLTNSGSQTGSYNSLRPFSINLSNGYVTMSNGVGVAGGLGVDYVNISGGNLSQSITNNSQNAIHITNAPTDQKNHDIIIDTGSVNYRFINDANTAANTWLSAARTGSSVTNINLNAAAIRLNGATAVTGGLTTDSLSVTGTGTASLFNASFFGATGPLSGTQWQYQGGYMGWNYTSGGGEMDFINSKGSGAGGFNWYNTSSSSTATLALIMSLNNVGALTLTSPLAITSGGTGATTASAALAALGGVAITNGTANGLLQDVISFGSGSGNGNLGSSTNVPGNLGAIGWNYSNGSGETAFFNCYTGAAAGYPAFIWHQKLTATTTRILMTLNNAGALALTVPLAISSGGTGAATAAAALTNLGGAPLASPTFTGTSTKISNNTGSLPASPAGVVLQLGGADTTNTRLLIDSFGNNSVLVLRRANGTAAAPTASQANDNLGEIAARGYGATGYQSDGSSTFTFNAAAAWTDSSQPSYITLTTTPVGSVGANSLERLRVQSTGAVCINTTVDDGVNKLQVNGGATASTPIVGDNSTNLATTAFVFTLKNGVTSIATTGGTTTLTNAQYGNAVLLVTGALTANAVLVVPNIGNWLVINRTTGAFTTTVKTSAGTGIACTQNLSIDLIADSTNVVVSGNDYAASGFTSSTNAVITGTAQVGTTTTTLGAQTVTGGGAGSTIGSNIIYNAGWKYVASDYGWFIRADNPGTSFNVTATGTAGTAATPIIAWSASPTGVLTVANIATTGGTINNTSIGATTPSTGAFTTLSANSTVTFNSPLPITSGGTGKNTATAARAAINQGSIALTSGSTIATDCSTGNVFTLTLASAATLSNPTNLVTGGVYYWVVKQDATGSRTLAYGTAFKWANAAGATLSTAANAVDVITGITDGTNVYAVLSTGFA